MNLSVRCSETQGKLDHFWRSTGFTPGELLLTRDMQQALTYVGSIPHGGIQYARIHFLLELVGVQPQPDGSLAYDWSLLDQGLDLLMRCHLTPIFEVMGNPSGFFNDFTDDRQLHQWKDMVTALALHLMDRYGRETVEGWYFEGWNEPDIGWWPQWPHNTDSYCNYYDACSEGLLAANPALRFGGPGSCVTFSTLFKAAVAHFDNGRNYFTGETGVRVDFISVHEKGAMWTPEDINPNTAALWKREADIVSYLRENHPRLAELPFWNDECDPQIGWWHIHTWHARPYYAAMVCRMINQHLIGLADGMGVPYGMLSNDNGFIGTWGNRTLMTRFGDPSVIEDGQLNHKPQIIKDGVVQAFPPFEMIKKPVLNVMALLSLLGDTRCKVEGASADPDAELGVLATRRGDGQVAVLVYHSRDRVMSSGEQHVRLTIEDLPFETAALAHYRIDEEHGDPFTLWEAAIAPINPTPALLAEMRCRQELELLEAPQTVSVERGALTLEFDLPLHAVSLLLLTAPTPAPEAVQDVALEQYEGLTGGREVMVTWKGLDSRAVRTYEVLAGPSAQGPFQRVNPADLICTAFLHVSEKTSAPLFYQVRAVDYWGRAGAESGAVTLKLTN